MKWIKKGKIFDNKTFNIEWFTKNAMVPLPYLINSNTIRIYSTMCDNDNVGRIGYIDVDADNPLIIKGYSTTPIIDIGPDGNFDDNGVVTASLLEDEGTIYMYYSSYQLCVKVPYMIFTGAAVSTDNGASFKKITIDAPILDRIEGEATTRCVPYVIKENGKYRIWYTSSTGSGWATGINKIEPLYNLKYMEADTPYFWPGRAFKVAIDFKDSDEHGICKSSVWFEDDKYKIIYSIRSLSKGYRLGYAESLDGLQWERKDDQIGIDVSANANDFDSEMVCFGERLEYKDKTYLFYSGNHYGMAGIGYAELER